jgi:hypothetical protein
MRLYYKDHRLILFGKIIVVYCENRTKHIYSVCAREKANFLNDNAHGTYSIYCDLEQWYSTFFVRVPPDIISFERCTPKVVGV